jgi:DNA-binding NtrC family response regulator
MNILIITDDHRSFHSLQDFCGKQGDIVSCIRDNDTEIVIIDLVQEELQDFELLQLVKSFDLMIEVIIVGDPASSEKVGESIRLGACEYVTKPLKINNFQSLLKRIQDKSILRQETLLLQKELNRKYIFQGIIGKSPYMLDVFSLIERVARYSCTVLITGETGTGKEMVAHAIHNMSPRSNKKLVVCDSTAMPESLFESELFGYVRGAFTGANRTKKGLFEEAHEGTLFLDEIGNLPFPLQSKLLRVLEERQFRRLGSTENIQQLDLRVVAATNRDLRAGVKNNTFREDLFHRISIVNINLPSLRERQEDIPLLCRHFILKYNKKLNKAIRGTSRRVQKILSDYGWPGNVRELENVVERSVALCPKTFIDIDDLPKYLEERYAIIESGPAESDRFLPLDELEKQHIKRVMEATQGNIQQTARILGVSRYTLYRKLKKIYDGDGVTKDSEA